MFGISVKCYGFCVCFFQVTILIKLIIINIIIIKLFIIIIKVYHVQFVPAGHGADWIVRLEGLTGSMEIWLELRVYAKIHGHQL